MTHENKPSAPHGEPRRFVVKVPKSSPSLTRFLDEEVKPRLLANLDAVFDAPEHQFFRTPAEWQGGCPHHPSKSGRSFTVDPATGRWYCAGCTVGGGILQYLAWRGGMGADVRGGAFVEMVERAAHLAGVPMPVEALSDEQREHARLVDLRQTALQVAYRVCRAVYLSEDASACEARKYTGSRGFTSEMAADLGVGLYPPVEVLRAELVAAGISTADIGQLGVLFNEMTGFVVFPWLDSRGHPQTIYGTNPGIPERPKKMSLPNPVPSLKTKASPLYLDRALKARNLDVVVVEGLTDAALAQAMGDTRVVSPVAGLLSAEQIETFQRRGVKSVTLALDPDSAGDKNIESNVNRLLGAGIVPYVASRLPEGVDPDEYILANGLDAWRKHTAQRTHGLRYIAQQIVEDAGEREPGDDGWGVEVRQRAERFAGKCQTAGRLDMLQHFWPTIATATGLPVEELAPEPGGGEVDGQSDPWPPPLTLGTPPPAPLFPVDVLPAKIARLVREAAEAFGCPPDFVAIAALAIAGGAIANSRQLGITLSHTQSAVLWAILIGRPGSAKSPPLNWLSKPLDKEEGRRRSEYRAALAAWEGMEKEDRGPKPTLSRCKVDNITVETLAVTLQENPRGLVAVRDELSSLVTGMNQYKSGKGDDRQEYLKMWSGTTLQSDRKSESRGPLFVPNPCVSIVGSVQPDVLPTLRGEGKRDKPAADDGFIDRFLMTYPADLPVRGETWAEISAESWGAWERTVASLLSLGMEEGEHGARPRTVHLSRDGKAAWKAFTDRHAEESNSPDFPDVLRGPWSKFRAYAARLSLVLHCLDWACQEGGTSDTDPVDGSTVERAERLVTYFKGHLRKAMSSMDPDRRIAGAKRLWDWIARKPRTSFKRWEAHNDLRSDSTFPTPDSLDVPLDMLAQHHLIRQVPPPVRKGRGRPPEPLWEVSPLALQIHQENQVNQANPPT